MLGGMRAAASAAAVTVFSRLVVIRDPSIIKL